MFTRCQACHTVHPLSAALLARGAGKYRCGKCNKVGNALESLFDEWPDSAQQGTRPGPIPTLGVPLTLGPTAPSQPDEPDSSPDAGRLDGPPRRWLLRFTWIVAGILLAGVITVQVADFFARPIFAAESLTAVLEKLGLRDPPPAAPFSDVRLIELLSREMQAHPTRPGVLLLSATIINRASQHQPYPEIQVTLLDIRGGTLARRRFRADEYLPGSDALRRGMAPNAFLPFTLELLDPGDLAVGFELELVEADRR